MRRLPLKLILAALLLLPAVASAQGGGTLQGTIELRPNVAGKNSRIHADVQPGVASGQEAPRSFSLFAVRGFKVDRRARAETCNAEQARQFNCPAASKIGAGSVQGRASGAIVPGGSQAFTASIEMYLGPPAERGDIAAAYLQLSEPQTGFRGSLRGRVLRVGSGPFGIETRFDELGEFAGNPFPGVTIEIDRIVLDAGASRVIKVKRTVRRRGKRVRVTKRVRVSLFKNPATCTGQWPYQVRIAYAGREDVRDGASACSAR